MEFEFHLHGEQKTLLDLQRCGSFCSVDKDLYVLDSLAYGGNHRGLLRGEWWEWMWLKLQVASIFTTNGVELLCDLTEAGNADSPHQTGKDVAVLQGCLS